MKRPISLATLAMFTLPFAATDTAAHTTKKHHTYIFSCYMQCRSDLSENDFYKTTGNFGATHVESCLKHCGPGSSITNFLCRIFSDSSLSKDNKIEEIADQYFADHKRKIAGKDGRTNVKFDRWKDRVIHSCMKTNKKGFNSGSADTLKKFFKYIEIAARK